MKTLFLAILFLFAGSLSAKEYFVSLAGVDNNIGSKASPFFTIQKALDIARPNDIITVERGTYKVNSGLTFRQNIITLRSFGGVVIDGNFRNSNLKFIDIKLHSYCVIENIIVKNIIGWGIWIDGDHNTIKNCSVINTSKCGISIIGASYNIISGNFVANVGTDKQKANNISVEGKVDINCNFTPANYNTIEYNKISKNKTHFGVNFLVSYAKDKNCTYDKSLIEGNIVRFNTIDSCWSGIYSRQNKGFEFYGNIIRYSDGISKDNEGHGIKLDIKDRIFFIVKANGKIYNNTIAFCKNVGLYNVNCSDLEIYNNAFYQNNLSNNPGFAYIKLNISDGIKISNNAYFGENISFNKNNEKISPINWKKFENNFYTGKTNILEKNSRGIIKGKGLNLKKINASFNEASGFSEKKAWNIGAFYK